MSFLERDFILAAIIGAIVIGLVTIYIISVLKGNVKVALSKRKFCYGEILFGEIKIEAKKIIYCNRLYVKLVGNEIVKCKNVKGENTKRSRVIYKKETEIRGALEYSAGTKHLVPFKLDIPEAFGLARAGNVEKFVANTLRNEYRHFEWCLTVHVDAKGLDLRDSARIIVS